MADENSRFDPPSEESPEWYDTDSSLDDDLVESYEDDYYDSSDAFLTDEDDLYYDEGGGGGPLFSRSPIILVLAVVAVIAILLILLRACGVIGATGSETSTPTVKPLATVAGEVAMTPGAEEVSATSAPPTATPVPPTPTPATVQVGANVVVAGTGEDGMSFRTGPGTKYIRVSVLKDGDQLKVVGGPEEADGFTWWRLEAEDGTIGWAVGTYLELASG